jgi:hypothetical protein
LIPSATASTSFRSGLAVSVGLMLSVVWWAISLQLLPASFNVPGVVASAAGTRAFDYQVLLMLLCIDFYFLRPRSNAMSDGEFSAIFIIVLFFVLKCSKY